MRLGWAGALLLAGCTVGPDFRAPDPGTPASWGQVRADVPSQTSTDEADPQWWTQFGDPVLSSLVARIAGENLDLQTAAERVLQGRAQRDVVASQGLPQVSGRSSYDRDRLSTVGNPAALVVTRPGAPVEFDVYQNGLSSSWDLDLFGRVRRGVESANAETQAVVEDRRGIALAALADLVQDYLQLRGIQAARAIAERNLAIAQQNTGLVRNRFDNGVATTLDTARALSQQSTIAATVPPLRAQEAANINAIGLLLGQPPRALEAELRPRAAQPGVPAVVPVGLPSTLVRRRPDLRRAEARLHAATAQIGVATAEFYPNVTLTGSFELQGLRFRDAFSLYARAFEVGPSISVPIFQGGRLRATLHLRESEQREAAINFRRTLLQAWQEVDNALTAYAEAQAQRKQVADAVAQNEVVLRAAQQRYVEGAVGFLDVNVAQSQLLQSQNDLADSDTRIASGLVALYCALGGGWEIAEAGGALGR